MGTVTASGVTVPEDTDYILDRGMNAEEKIRVNPSLYRQPCTPKLHF